MASEGERVVGRAALLPFSRRPVYRGVAETSVYVAAQERGKYRHTASQRLDRGVGEARSRIGLRNDYPDKTAMPPHAP